MQLDNSLTTLFSLSLSVESPPQSASLASALTETGPSKEAVQAWDPIAEMCQQLTKGLTGLDSQEQKNNSSIATVPQAPAVTQATVTTGEDRMTLSLFFVLVLGWA